MEPVLVAGYTQMLKVHHRACSVDRILEHPDLRNEFLGLVRKGSPDSSEFDILHGLHNLRKKSRLPRCGD